MAKKYIQEEYRPIGSSVEQSEPITEWVEDDNSGEKDNEILSQYQQSDCSLDAVCMMDEHKEYLNVINELEKDNQILNDKIAKYKKNLYALHYGIKELIASDIMPKHVSRAIIDMRDAKYNNTEFDYSNPKYHPKIQENDRTSKFEEALLDALLKSHERIISTHIHKKDEATLEEKIDKEKKEDNDLFKTMGKLVLNYGPSLLKWGAIGIEYGYQGLKSAGKLFKKAGTYILEH